jgi:hypothetical protein|uniref:Uncharacterized protein n=1 Tax=CrAss-like virus sp. ctXt06 TaxID=2825837 RepID=A0A8S5V6R8_9CAUD|nr:MAG TPA: hypothetical protein [CrAss-like virus sp. ctXt06]
MIVEWKEVDVDGYKIAVDTYEAECSIKDFTNTCTGEVIDVRHEQPGFFSKGKTIYIVRSISDNSIREVEATKCKVKYK